MKLAALLTAFLAGLPSSLMAARITADILTPSSLTQSFVDADLDFNPELLDSAFTNGICPEADQPEVRISADIDFYPIIIASPTGDDNPQNQEAFAIPGQEPGIRRVPEPPAVATLALGVSFLGICGLWFRSRGKKRRLRRRRVVRMREIMAER